MLVTLLKADSSHHDRDLVIKRKMEEICRSSCSLCRVMMFLKCSL